MDCRWRQAGFLVAHFPIVLGQDEGANAQQSGSHPMSSQTQDPAAEDYSGVAYPDYARDAELFSKFLQQHRIRVALSDDPDRFCDDDDDDDDDVLLEPTRDGDRHARVRQVPCYLGFLQRVVDRNFYEMSSRTFVMEVPLDEIRAWDPDDGAQLADRASRNTLRYVEVFSAAVDKALEGLEPSAATATATGGGGRGATGARPERERDPVDIFREQRLAQQQSREAQRNQQVNEGMHNLHVQGEAGTLQRDADPQDDEFPPILMRRYELRILPSGRRGTLPPFVGQIFRTNAAAPPRAASLRQIRSRSMGRLVTITGMIARASDVKPCCQVAAYSCDACGLEVYQVVDKQREFLPQRTCRCRSPLHLQTRGSKFVKHQELKLQESPSQVPMGHVPRSLSVYCRGELTRLCSPGDTVTVDGVFLPQKIAESGYRAMKAGLVATTFLEAQNIIVHKKTYDESIMDALTEEESAALEEGVRSVATSDDPIGKLSASLAPEIFGHEDIKRSLLLQLVGGCTRTLPDGMRIRGDINICLMGDPGVAKSQLLKHVASIAPRGVYTTGKGSSGVGLTAAVTKDMATGEMALEGGALVLADRGICCIDEFDKMDESDRTSIHEVMEQQTVSIAKAGIVATLNARAAVLAAANPLYSRYNRRKSLSENINLPNSLLSRFDLLFLVLDIADVDRDMALARHVTLVHQNEGRREKNESDDSDGEHDTEEDDAKTLVSPKVLREYITRARKHHPIMPPEVAPYVVEAYVALRSQDRDDGPSRGGSRSSKQNDQTVMTARQLLSILRLSQALARLRFSDVVAREDVDEAIRLTHMSKASLLDEENDLAGKKRGEDVMSRIYNIIRDYSVSSGSREVEMTLCEAMVLRKGFTSQQLQACLEEYELLEVLQVNRNRTHVYFPDKE